MILSEELNEQRKYPEYKDDAEACIKIMNALKDIHNGHVWSGDWQVLVDTTWPPMNQKDGTLCIKKHRPSKIGEIFLKGLTVK